MFKHQVLVSQHFTRKSLVFLFYRTTVKFFLYVDLMCVDQLNPWSCQAIYEWTNFITWRCQWCHLLYIDRKTLLLSAIYAEFLHLNSCYRLLYFSRRRYTRISTHWSALFGSCVYRPLNSCFHRAIVRKVGMFPYQARTWCSPAMCSRTYLMSLL